MTERPQKITFGEMREMGVRGRAAIAVPTCGPISIGTRNQPPPAADGAAGDL
jgi:hypothetical protein